MHELSLCQSVIEVVETAVRRENVGRVTTIVLEVGELGGVMPEAMLFCFDAVSRGTVAEGARLVIERIPGAGWCLDCAGSVPIAERFGACPQCGQRHVQMISGDELRVREVEIA